MGGIHLGCEFVSETFRWSLLLLRAWVSVIDLMHVTKVSLLPAMGSYGSLIPIVSVLDLQGVKGGGVFAIVAVYLC